MLLGDTSSFLASGGGSGPSSARETCAEKEAAPRAELSSQVLRRRVRGHAPGPPVLEMGHHFPSLSVSPSLSLSLSLSLSFSCSLAHSVSDVPLGEEDPTKFDKFAMKKAGSLRNSGTWRAQGKPLAGRNAVFHCCSSELNVLRSSQLVSKPCLTAGQVLYAFNNSTDAQRTYREAGMYWTIRQGKAPFHVEHGGLIPHGVRQPHEHSL